ncbi:MULTISPECIES: pseudouridine synthase [unclassified Moraxella]|uniref:pseudouridine synthase n=1 Tax=unclassified Moraxella TaxID=2685852 RepID=UPI003AF77BE1
MPKLILFNKPFGVLSQFRQDDNNTFATLGDYFRDKSLRVAGRLDATSEGLLLLTDDGQVNKALTHPPKANQGKKQGKTYWVQVAGFATAEQLAQLRQGVALKDGLTLPAQVEVLDSEAVEAQIWQAPEGVGKRKINTWLAITIFEGKNRQVRRMTAHVGLPCLRLIRMASSGFELGQLGVGESRQIALTALELQRLGIASQQCKPID